MGKFIELTRLNVRNGESKALLNAETITTVEARDNGTVLTIEGIQAPMRVKEAYGDVRKQLIGEKTKKSAKDTEAEAAAEA